MVSRRIRITDETGLHLRPAGRLCEKAGMYRASVNFLHEGTEVNAKSVLSVLAAGVRNGDVIELICDGPDEDAAMTGLTEILDAYGDPV